MNISVSKNIASSIKEIRKKQLYFRRDGGQAKIELKSNKVSKLVELKDNNNIRGWAVIIKQYQRDEVWIYIHNKFRRKGYGTKMIKKLNYEFKESQICKHDIPSIKFWNKLLKYK